MHSSADLNPGHCVRVTEVVEPATFQAMVVECASGSVPHGQYCLIYRACVRACVRKRTCAQKLDRGSAR
jgi:hypothetical protein